MTQQMRPKKVIHKNQLPLWIEQGRRCEECFEWYPWVGRCRFNFPERYGYTADFCDLYDRRITCIGGRIYPEKQGCGIANGTKGGCHTCYEKFMEEADDETQRTS